MGHVGTAANLPMLRSSCRIASALPEDPLTLGLTD